jgi:hypothetical protein
MSEKTPINQAVIAILLKTRDDLTVIHESIHAESPVKDYVEFARTALAKAFNELREHHGVAVDSGESPPQTAASGPTCPRCQCREEPRDELETLGLCFESLYDLLIPEKDLHAVDRSNFALLFGYLVRRQKAALEACFYAPRGEAG